MANVNNWLLATCCHCILCRDGPDEVKMKTMEAKRMLDVWKKAYFDVRAKIEASGRDSRWEFDRKKLFERTDYMASICQDLYNVAQVKSFTLQQHFVPRTKLNLGKVVFSIAQNLE